MLPQNRAKIKPKLIVLGFNIYFNSVFCKINVHHLLLPPTKQVTFYACHLKYCYFHTSCKLSILTHHITKSVFSLAGKTLILLKGQLSDFQLFYPHGCFQIDHASKKPNQIFSFRFHVTTTSIISSNINFFISLIDNQSINR